MEVGEVILDVVSGVISILTVVMAIVLIRRTERLIKSEGEKVKQLIERMDKRAGEGRRWSGELLKSIQETRGYIAELAKREGQ